MWVRVPLALPISMGRRDFFGLLLAPYVARLRGFLPKPPPTSAELHAISVLLAQASLGRIDQLCRDVFDGEF